MLMLSEFSRFRVADGRGARARLDDLAVALLEDDHPPVTLLLYTGGDKRQRSLKWEAASVERGRGEIKVEDLGAGRTVSPDSLKDEVLLTRDVLDALVLDLQNRRATRANDLALEERDGVLRLRAADTTARALLRRPTRGPFPRPPARSLYA